MPTVSTHLSNVIDALQEAALDMVHDPSKFPDGLIVTFIKLFRDACYENRIPSPANVLKTPIAMTITPQAIHGLTLSLLLEPGGDGDYEDRRTAAINGIHTLLSIAVHPAIETVAFWNLLYKLMKGAVKAAPAAYGNKNLSADLAKLDERFFHDAKLLPPTALRILVNTILDKDNWL